MVKLLIILMTWVILLSSCSDSCTCNTHGFVFVKWALGKRTGQFVIDTIGAVGEHMQIGDTILIHHAGWSWPTPREYVITDTFYVVYKN